MAARRLRLGMVGGGLGAFIGAVHRIAARMDDQYELVAGCFSTRPDNNRASGEEFHVSPDRVYADFLAMAEAEAKRPDGADVVAICTPNHLHHAPAAAFIGKKIAVLCDKPLTSTLDDARDLARLVSSTNVPFGVTYNYSAYPMVRAARALVQNGELGEIRVVQVEYAQDWLADDIESAGQKQAAWRTDPALAGAGGSLGDIGTHAAHLASFVSRRVLTHVAADTSRFVPGRRLDDNANVLLRFESGAKGMLWASQIAVGSRNGLALRVIGDKGAIAWRQENPEELIFARKGLAQQSLFRNGPGSAARGRIPGGHPEGYLEAFATLYSEFADEVRAHHEGRMIDSAVPSVDDGVAGVRFVEACAASAAAGGTWREI